MRVRQRLRQLHLELRLGVHIAAAAGLQEGLRRLQELHGEERLRLRIEPGV